MLRESLPRPEDRLALGASLQVSPFCLGMVDGVDTVLAAFDVGVNFFFLSADMHWPLYDPLRRGLEQLLARGGGIRDHIVVAGVSYATQPEFCAAPFTELVDSVRGLERLDVLIAGGSYGYELDRRMPMYRRHREHAFCGARAIGSSFHDRTAAIAPLRDATLDLCLVRYNSGHVGARVDLLPHVSGRRALLYNFKSTLGFVPPARCDELGLDPQMWRPSITDHYRFVLSHPEFDGILCSLTAPSQVDELVAALDDGALDPDEQQHLELLSRLHAGSSELKP